jgi:glycosyltransferase involved in cell wall biosynthesis
MTPPTAGRARTDEREPTIAVVIPCHNEEAFVGTVVRDFAATLPTAQIYVYDNASTDSTADRAREAGAITCAEPRKGKGNAVRRMFADVDADIYVMVDGDATYDPATAPSMVKMLLEQNLDMIVAARRAHENDEGVYRKGHTSGNAWFTRMIRRLFGGEFSDVLSGYRVMSRRFVKSLPVFSEGFEIETELSAHAVRVRAACDEVPTQYRSRGDGSLSKLRTYRDGFRILLHIIRLYEEMRPLQFFTFCGAVLTAIALGLGIPVIDEFARTGLVLRFPTAILALGIQIVAFICLTAGIILRSVGRTRDEARRLVYLSLPPPSSLDLPATSPRAAPGS